MGEVGPTESAVLTKRRLVNASTYGRLQAATTHHHALNVAQKFAPIDRSPGKRNDIHVISSSIDVIWEEKTTADLGKCGNPQAQLATGDPVDRFAALADGLRVVGAW